ncbi:hypothetical protein [Halobaculum roseum]|uniref:Lipoprotein n=1 Tax=Halobaculum roseum TaxID=2175149 RepID=A0ABD5MPU3_9EURY|nr:hypothetical protein [Halobaculum roseum]QZY02211.1 hypothetical protein K6T36_13020 [Halobaculum roseum]
MDRRTVLTLVAGAGSTALAGCTGGGGSGGGDEPTTEPSETPTKTPAGTGPPTDTGTGSPSVVDRSFARTGDASEPGESASVAFGGDAVTVSGVISGKNGCMQASLKSVEYDADADELRVRVETVREGGDVCTQQIVYREYEASVTFEGGLPTSVVVEHESMDEVRTVTDVTR